MSTFEVLDVVASAVAVYKVRDFNARTFLPYMDVTTSKYIECNHSAVLTLLNNPSHINTADDIATASNIIDYFKQQFTLAKISDKLSDFQLILSNRLSNDRIDIADTYILTLLPHTFTVSIRQDELDQLYQTNTGTYVCNIGDRVKIECFVVDFKWTRRAQAYAVVGVTKADQIVKFYVKPSPINISPIRRKNISFIGYVKTHRRNGTKCETILDRVNMITVIQ